MRLPERQPRWSPRHLAKAVIMAHASRVAICQSPEFFLVQVIIVANSTLLDDRRNVACVQSSQCSRDSMVFVFDPRCCLTTSLTDWNLFVVAAHSTVVSQVHVQ